MPTKTEPKQVQATPHDKPKFPENRVLKHGEIPKR